MQKDTAFRDYLLHDLFWDIFDLEIRAMMGGNMIKKSWLAVGILEDGVVYLKVGPENMGDFDLYDAKWFTYRRNNQEVRLGFREVPIDILEDRDAIKIWLSKAYDVALNAPKKWKKRSNSSAPTQS